MKSFVLVLLFAAAVTLSVASGSSGSGTPATEASTAPAAQSNCVEECGQRKVQCLTHCGINALFGARGNCLRRCARRALHCIARNCN